MQIKEPKEGLNLSKSFSEHRANHGARISVAAAATPGAGTSAGCSPKAALPQEHKTYVFTMDLCTMPLHSRCHLSAPWWNRCLNHSQSLKKQWGSWGVSGKVSFLHHSKLPHWELAEKLPNLAQGQLHFTGRIKLVEKQLSDLCISATIRL